MTGRAETTGVPFLDLGAIHAPLSEGLLADVAELIDTGRFIDGPQVDEFEQAFAAYCGSGALRRYRERPRRPAPRAARRRASSRVTRWSCRR